MKPHSTVGRLLSAVFVLFPFVLPQLFAAAKTSFRNLPPVVFVSRNPLPPASSQDLPGSGPQFRTSVVGGKLLVRERNGTLRILIDSTKLIDVADPCVSWDARKILFSGVQNADSCWRIFEINTDGTNFHQLTFSDRTIDLSQFGAAAKLFRRYDDFDPCYLPNGKIVFASTRYPSMAMAAHVQASNLYVMEGQGRILRRITSERNGGRVTLTVFDAVGREIRTLANEEQSAGFHEATFDAANTCTLASGIYLYRLIVEPSNSFRTPQFISVKQMLLLK